MGTRHLIGAVLDGDFKIAQYGQWDGYPDGQGLDVLKFLRTADLDDFTDRVRVLRFAAAEDEATIASRWAELGADGSGWVNMAQSEAFYADKRYAALSRDVGAEVLTMVAGGQVEFLNDSRDFAKDSLFCEWAYVIDLDRRVLEVYEGFQKSPPTAGRWVGVDAEGEYHPVSLVKEYALGDLPTPETFCADLESDDED